MQRMRSWERTGILLIPFSSVIVWSCTLARAHTASPKADSDVESHISESRVALVSKQVRNPVYKKATMRSQTTRTKSLTERKECRGAGEEAEI